MRNSKYWRHIEVGSGVGGEAVGAGEVVFWGAGVGSGAAPVASTACAPGVDRAVRADALTLAAWCPKDDVNEPKPARTPVTATATTMRAAAAAKVTAMPGLRTLPGAGRRCRCLRRPPDAR